MKVEKKVISKLTKCYSIAPLTYQGKEHFLVAAEKADKCILFDLEGNQEDVIWEEPGGVMTMVQVPGTDGQFLATHKFFSPNDSKEAKIVIVTPRGKGDWEVRTLTNLPFVHRFDILERNGVRYLIACALKSGHEYPEDWSMPGKVYAAVLPEDLSGFDEEHPIELKVIKDQMLKNHGYYRIVEQGIQTGVISADCGVFQFVPPAEKDGDWEIRELISDPASDAVLVDLDGDGEQELAVIAPFHGDTIRVYKKNQGKFEKVFEYEKKTEFLHSIYGGMLAGEPSVVLGHRKGERNLMVLRYDRQQGSYYLENMDEDCGSANVYHYVLNGKDWLVSTNREIDEVALYTLEK